MKSNIHIYSAIGIAAGLTGSDDGVSGGNLPARHSITIRPVVPEDNAPLAVVVKETLAEFGANHPGTVYFDPTTDALYELFRTPRSAYFVAEKDGRLLGGGGIFPTEGLPADTCELVKMYLVPEARGIGLGKAIILECFRAARREGFSRIYLETMPELQQALKVYEKFGFRYLSGPMGNSGHFGCELWMIKDLDDFQG
jgi:putative acetyltransferase